MELHRLSLTEGIRAIERGEITSEQWTRALLARIAQLDPRIEAFAWLDPAAAIARAVAADRATAGRLRGAPIGVKDIIDTRAIPTRMGSPAYNDNVPTRSATVVERLENAGAFAFGKTVTAELAFYTPGKTRNPWNPAHTPGGSSSGSAAAVAAGFMPAALGTQTNGSIIRPAAYCGCFGFKPSFGRVPRGGVLRFSRALDHIGFFTRTVEDAALLYSLCAGADAADADSVDAPASDTTAHVRRDPPRLIAVRTPVWDRAEPHAQAHFADTIQVLRAAGAAVEERELPAVFADAHAVLRTIMYAEGARSYAALKREHGPLLSGMIHALIDEGLEISETRLREALSERTALVRALGEFLASADAILTPPATGEAPATLTSTGDPSFCTLWTLCGVPAISVPSGRGPLGLPLGTQLVGKPLADAELLATAQWCAPLLRHELPRLAF
jgi:Asp-tRNA(Asn)/Glu-tRNA(Gln) amidotransferase A subunit family amidase